MRISCSSSILFTTLLFALILGVSECPAQESPQDQSIQYTVDLADVKNHYVTIELEAPSRGATTELMMAVWTPGSYLVREYARHLDSFEVSDVDGGPLKFEKIRKNRWLIETGDSERFRLKYRLYCNELSVRTNWVGRQYAVLNGAATFLTLPEKLDRPHRVQLKMPKGWKRSATSLRADGEQPHSYVAEDFDELVDSPIVAGNLTVYPFMAGEIEHQLVNVGESGYWDGSKAATDLKRMVEAHHQMWGAVPYDRYLFLNVIGERGGGLEHDNSTLIMTSRWSYRDEKRYKDWLSLASHEFFHTWNVRRLRPKSLVEYDYENEVYTESLWVAEGVTSYYEDLILARAGLFSRKEFIERLSKSIESVQSINGRKMQSLKDSSYDTWIKFYRPDENASNTRVSYYSKGAVVAFLLDARIRSITNGEKSLDDVMRKLWSDFLDKGYSPQDFRDVASDVAGEDLTEWFAATVDSTRELSFDDLASLGLEIPGAGIVAKKQNEEATQEGEDKGDLAKEASEESQQTSSGSDSQATAKSKETKQSAGKPKPWLGIRTSGSDGRVTVSSIRTESPATEAGINPGDEIIAVNGFRITSSIDSRLNQYEVGDEVTVLISRRGKLVELPVVIGAVPKRDWKMKLIEKPDKDQSKQRTLWLN